MEMQLSISASAYPTYVRDSTRDGRPRRRLETAHEVSCAVQWTHRWAGLRLEDYLRIIEQAVPPQPSVDELACILFQCRKEKNRECALRLLAIVRNSGLEAHPSISNHLVSTLAEVGSLSDAHWLFDRLACRHENTWNCLITANIRCGERRQALSLYQDMQLDGSVHPSPHTFVALLKVCMELKDLGTGHKLHAHLALKGLLGKDAFVGSALVSMYTKCGSLPKAQLVFDKLPVRDMVLWTALIAGYVQHRQGKQALRCFQLMEIEGVIPDALTFVWILKACSMTGDTDKGQEMHAKIAKKGLLEDDVFVGNAVVDMYVKFGLLEKAREVFDKIPVRSVVLWNSLLTGYAQQGLVEDALSCYQQMQLQSVSPNAVTFLCILKACSTMGALEKGQEIHLDICRRGLLETDLVVGTALVDMYVRCGSLGQAQELFVKLPVRDIVLWTVLMAGYAQHGHGEEALNCFEQMKLEGILPDAVTYICSLKACSSIGSVEKGREVHSEIARTGSLERDDLVGTALVDMYARCGSLASAEYVFDRLTARNVISWNALITGYAHHGHGQKVLKSVEQMQHVGLSPDAVTFVCSLAVCGSLGDIEKGLEIHSEISRQGLLESNLFVGNAVVDMYCKFGLLAKAQEVFDNLPVRDVVSWNTLIGGYVQHGCGEKALYLFDQMQLDGFSPDAVTFICSLKACGSIGATDKGREIHTEILRQGLLKRNVVVGNALVDMYAKCGLLPKAQEVFDKLPLKNLVSWNALIAGYAQHGQGQEALNSLEHMRHEGLSPDAVTFVCCLKACGSIGAKEKGQKLHSEIARTGLSDTDLVIGTALVDMYAKCGLLTKAQEMFDKLPVRDTVSWTALMTGYAQVGDAKNVFHTFDKMIEEGVKPVLATFSCVLNACSHSGLVDKGQAYFVKMNKDYGLIPSPEHCTCIVDLLSRAGQIDKAVGIIQEVPCRADPVLWHTLLGACQKWGKVDLGRWAFEHAVQLNDKDHAVYVCMSNIYSDAGMQEDADKVQAMGVRNTSVEANCTSLQTDANRFVHAQDICQTPINPMGRTKSSPTGMNS